MSVRIPSATSSKAVASSIATILTLFAVAAARAEGPTDVCGEIDASHSIWTSAGSPYVICGNGACTAAGVTLHIGSGVEVQGGSLSGTIQANGAVFTNAGTGGDLSITGCTFTGSGLSVDTGSVLSSTFSGSGISISSGSVQSSTINGATTGIAILGGGVEINNCKIDGCVTGIYADASGSTIRNCQLISNTTGLYLATTIATLEGNTWDNTDWDVYLQEGEYTGDLALVSQGGILRVGIGGSKIGLNCAPCVSFADGTLTLQGPMEVELAHECSGISTANTNGHVVADDVVFTSTVSSVYELLVVAYLGSVSLTDCEFAGTLNGVYAYGAHAEVTDCHFSNTSGPYGYGVRIGADGSASVTNTVFDGTLPTGVILDSPNVVLDGCTIGGCTTGINISSSAAGSAIRNCNIAGNVTGMYFAPQTGSVTLEGNTWSNTDWDVYLQNGEYTGDLALVSPGGILRVGIGGSKIGLNCAPCVSFADGTLTLQGPMEVELAHECSGISTANTNGHVVADDVVFTSTVSSVYELLVVAYLGSVSLTDCEFAGTLNGVYAYGAHAEVTDCHFSNTSGPYGYGVRIGADGSASVTNTVFDGTLPTGVILDSPNVVLDGCTIGGCTTGINISSSAAGSAIRNCNIAGNVTGMYFAPQTGSVTLEGNTWSNTDWDVYLQNGEYTGDLALVSPGGILRVGIGGSKIGLNCAPCVSFADGTLTLQGPMEVELAHECSGISTANTNGHVVADDVVFTSTVSSVYELLVVAYLGSVSLTDCEFAGTLNGVYAYGAHAEVTDCHFSNTSGPYGYGVRIGADGSTSVTNTVFDGTLPTGVILDSPNVVLDGCTIGGCTTGINISSSAAGSAIRNCNIAGNVTGMYFAPQAGSVTLEGNTWGNTDWDVYLQEGEYTGDLALVSPGGILRVGIGGSKIGLNCAPCVSFADGTLTLQGPMEVELAHECSGIGTANTNGHLVADDIVFTSGANSIYELLVAAVQGGSVSLTNCELTGTLRGVYVGEGHAEVTDCHFSNTNGFGFGISVGANGSANVTNTVFDGTLPTGVILDSPNVVLAGCTIGGCATGIDVTSSASGSVVWNCSFSGATTGISAVNDGLNCIASRFDGCATAIHVPLGSGARQGVARYCDFTDCGWGVNNASGTTVDARWCWWGDPSGPGPVGPGSGAQVSTNVLYEPWLGQPWTNEDHYYGLPPNSGLSDDPVNTAMGNFTHGETDLAVTSRGPALTFGRYYNSRDTYIGPLGPGWTSAYNVHLVEEGGVVSIKWADGHVDRSIARGDGTYEPIDTGVYDTLTQEIDDTWTLVKKNLTVYRFDVDGSLLSIADKNGNTLTCAYNLGAQLESVTDPAGRQLTFTFDSGLLTQVADPAGRTVGFGYTAGRLTQVTDVLGHTTDYGYDANGYLESITDQRGVQTVFNVYDAEGRVIEQHDGRDNPTFFEYDMPESGDTRLTDALGHQTIHTHEDYLLKTITYPNTSTIEYTYDAQHNRTSIKDRNDHVVQFDYDARGNVTQTTAPDEGVTIVEQTDPRFPDLLTRKADAEGTVTEWEYDDNGNVLVERQAVGTALESERSWTYNAWGQVLTETDELDHVTTYEYDTTPGRDGLLLWVEDAEGNRTWNDYDTLWRRTTVTDARGAALGDPAYTTTYTYDDGDRLTDVIGPPVGDPPHSITRHYDYDNIGNRTLVRDGNGNERTYVYDGNSNLRFINEPLGRTTEYQYDELNRKTLMIDANDHETIHAYDNMGNLTSVTRQMYGDGPDLVTEYMHDNHGNVLMVTDPSLRTITYTYDEMNRKVSQTDDLGHVWSWEYDDLGRVTLATDANQSPTAYDYDELGRLWTVTVWNDQEEPETTSYDYDLTGNLTWITDAGGRTTEKRYNAVGWLEQQLDGIGNSYHYGYDAVGNQTSVLDANGATIGMVYDAESRLMAINYPDANSVGFSYDDNGNRVGMTDLTGHTTYVYDALDRLTSSTDSFGKTVGYGYDLIGNRTTLTYPGDLPVTYGYDAADRMRTITDWAGRVTSFTYDDAGRIVAVSYPNGVEHARDYDGCGRLDAMDYQLDESTLLGYAWTRDQEGNPLSQTEEGTLDSAVALPPEAIYTYDDDNRLTSSSEGTYQYDNNGNLTQRNLGGATTTFAYDYEDRLISQTTGSSVVDHIYDGGGYRVARINNGAETRYVLDRGRSMSHVLCEADEAGVVTAYYIHGPQLTARIGADGSQRYYHTDAIGNVATLTDEMGMVTDRYAYTPFGIPAGQEGPTPNPFTYVGGLGVMAEADGLYFMRARFYDPLAGRFLGKDPLEGTLVCPSSQEPYTYVTGRPVTQVDPDGNVTLGARLLSGSVSGLVNVLWFGIPEIGSELIAIHQYNNGEITAAELNQRVMPHAEFKRRGAAAYRNGFLVGMVNPSLKITFRDSRWASTVTGRFIAINKTLLQSFAQNMLMKPVKTYGEHRIMEILRAMAAGDSELDVPDPRAGRWSDGSLDCGYSDASGTMECGNSVVDPKWWNRYCKPATPSQTVSVPTSQTGTTTTTTTTVRAR